MSRSLKSALSMPVSCFTLVVKVKISDINLFQIGIVVDNPEDQISADTLLETGFKDSTLKRAADCLASRIVEVGVILVWHGFWTLTDVVTEEVCEMNHTESTFFSLSVGLSGGLFLFVLQFPLLKFYNSSESNVYARHIFLAVNFIFNLAGVYVTINRYFIYSICTALYLCFQFPFQLVSPRHLLPPHLPCSQPCLCPGHWHSGVASLTLLKLSSCRDLQRLS